MKIAIVHEWLVTYAGSEKALEQILHLYPDADVYCVLDCLAEKDRGFLNGHKVTSSFIQWLPFSRTRYRSYLPLMPYAIRRFDLSDYDVVISSNHAVANGVKTTSNQIHISYIYSPMRYVWDLREQYLQESNLDKGVTGIILRYILDRLRCWDYQMAQDVNYFIAISDYIRKRVYRCYRRDAEVVYPPVDTEYYVPRGKKSEFYLAASRMVPYKMMPLIVAAFNSEEMSSRKLVVIGDGPELERVEAVAGDNVEVLGYQEDELLRGYLQEAKALIFAAEEDFGILPVEAQACGTPVIAFSKGGALETVNGLEHEKPTGVFFTEQTTESIHAAVDAFELNLGRISVQNCREKALDFSVEVFRVRFKKSMEGIVTV